MSKDWSPDELAAASAAMKAAGHMGYEEFCGELFRQGINLEVKHMKYKIFHTTSVKERFLSWDSAQRDGLHPEYYVRVYEGEIVSNNMDDLPEELYRIFNTDPPADYRGRALSVSDIITVSDGDTQKSYFCDSVGFKEIEFKDAEPTVSWLMVCTGILKRRVNPTTCSSRKTLRQTDTVWHIQEAIASVWRS